MKLNTFLSSFLMCACITSTVCAADKPTAQFLLVGQGARAEAMAHAVVASCADNTASYWNPAGLAFLRQGEAGFSHTQLPGNMNDEFLSIVYPYRKYGFGVHVIMHTSVMDFYDSSGIQQGRGDGEKSSNMTASFAWRCTPYFSLGCGIGRIAMALHRNDSSSDYEASAFTSNIGTLYSNGRASLGLMLGNFGTALKLSSVEEKQPELMRIGAGYELSEAKTLLISSAYTYVFNDENARELGISGEYRISNLFMLRAGYRFMRNNNAPSLGFGVQIRSFIFDYAWSTPAQSLSQLDYHRASLSFRFGEIRQPAATGTTQPPEIVVQYLKQNDLTFEPKQQILHGDTLELIGTVMSDPSTMLDRIIVSVNGKTVIQKTSLDEKKYAFDETIQLREGKNTIAIIAYDTLGHPSEPKELHVVYEQDFTKGKHSIPDFVTYESQKGGTMFAVLIGIGNYPSKSGFDTLDYAANDVTTLKASLLHDVKNMREEHMFTLGEGTCNPHDTCNYVGDATRKNIEEFLGDTLPEKLKPNDRVLIFFSGHGITIDTGDDKKKQGLGFLVPVDGEADKPFSTCISMDVISQLSQRLPAKQVLFIVDACKSGLVLSRNKGDDKKKNTDALIRSFLTDARQAMTATKSDQTAQMISGYQQSVYTHFLIEGLHGKADTSGDGVIPISELYNYVRDKVSLATDNKQTPQMGRIRDGGEGEFFFIRK